jgi:hypothetical protein
MWLRLSHAWARSGAVSVEGFALDALSKNGMITHRRFREHHGVQARQGRAGNTVLCGSIRGSRMARSMGRTDGHMISR